VGPNELCIHVPQEMFCEVHQKWTHSSQQHPSKVPQNVGPNELCIFPQHYLVNITRNVGPNELCLVPQQHLVNIAQNVGPNELCIVPKQHLLNIPQNVGMNELCIISHYVGTSNNLSKIKAWLDKFMWQFAFPICISFLHRKRSEILWWWINNTYLIT
jgi:hypothetical protein